MRVKICGVTDLAGATVAVEAGAWAIGLNFVPGSPRCLAPAQAKAIADRVRGSVEIVGVFANEDRRRIEAARTEVGLSMLQFHGDESAEDCRGWPVATIKALRIRDRPLVEAAAGYAVDFVLADAYVEGSLGGTGQCVDRSLLRGFDPQRLILAGGLKPENVAGAVREVRPYAVDVASGVECRPGRKDPARVRRLIENANAA